MHRMDFVNCVAVRLSIDWVSVVMLGRRCISRPCTGMDGRYVGCVTNVEGSVLKINDGIGFLLILARKVPIVRCQAQ